MKALSYNILKSRQKSYIKAYAVLCLIIALSMGFYTYQKFNEYSVARAVVKANDKLIEALQSDSLKESADFNDKKDDFTNLQNQISTELAEIFPASDNYQSLTIQLDTFEQQISSKKNPFEVSNIAYQSVQESEGYSVLPLRMTIKSSPDNFRKFLHFVESSGALNSGTRLMDISSIRLNFQDNEDGGELITFTVQINAYFRN